jgi:hypothetical protein
VSAVPAPPALEKITLADVFTRFWPAYKSGHGEHIPRAHVKAAEAVLACRTELRGVVRSVCDGCSEVTVAPISCGHRACPKCGTAQALAWRGRRAAKLLPVEHFLVTFTVPEELRGLIRSHPEASFGAMFRAHASALGSTIREKLGGCGGWTSVLHTWTRQLIYHPHIHSIAAGLAMTADGIPRRVTKRGYLVPHALLGARWRDQLHAELSAIRTPDSAFEKQLAPIPASTWRRKWVVDLQAVGSGEKAMSYLARYVQKTALDHARIVALDETSVTIGWRDRESKKQRHTKLSGHEFLRRFLQHVIPGGFMRIRHGGFYAPAARKRYRALAALLGHAPQLAEPWTPKCAKCGGDVYLLSIRVGKRTIIPQRTRAHYGSALKEEAQPPTRPP